MPVPLGSNVLEAVARQVSLAPKHWFLAGEEDPASDQARAKPWAAANAVSHHRWLALLLGTGPATTC